MEESLKKILENLKHVGENEILDKVENMQVLKLAFIGDTIFDMFTRDYLLRKYGDKILMNNLHKENTYLVCAKSQARIVETLIDNGVLTESEIEFYKHARNAHPHSKSKNSSIIDYRKATGFEALLGMLFYMDDKRLIEVLEKVLEIIDSQK